MSAANTRRPDRLQTPPPCDASLSSPVEGAAPLDQVVALLREVFPSSPKFQDDGSFLDWLYLRNPDGSAVWRDLIVDGRSLAHYGSIPQIWGRGEERALMYLSLHSATHENLRGKGAFVRLGEATYAAQQAITPAVAGAIGVPNRQAAPPRAKKLGWSLFETLPLRISLGLPFSFRKSIAARAPGAVADQAFLSDAMLSSRRGWRQAWSREKLAWRASNPLETIWLHRLGPVAAFVSVRSRHGLPVIAVILKTFAEPEAGPTDLGPLAEAIRARHKVFAVAHVGRNADVRLPGFDFPEKWRPSPLILGGRGYGARAFDFRDIDCFEAWDYDLF